MRHHDNDGTEIARKDFRQQSSVQWDAWLNSALLARSAGAHVIGTGRAGASERVLELGADDFVDVERDGWETTIDPVDLVYDAIGGDVLAHSPAIVNHHAVGQSSLGRRPIAGRSTPGVVR